MLSSIPMVLGSKPNSIFFKVPRLSLAAQSVRVWGGKIVHGWPLILKNSFRLIQRFVLGRMPVPKR
jgi:hypothetical protein